MLQRILRNQQLYKQHLLEYQQIINIGGTTIKESHSTTVLCKCGSASKKPCKNNKEIDIVREN